MYYEKAISNLIILKWSQTTAWIVNTDINKLTIQNEDNRVGSNTSYTADNQMATYILLFET